MADINHVTLVGRLTRDAELKYTNSGQAVSKIGIAINQRRRRDDQWVDEAHFFDCVVWGRTAEALNPYLVKGKQVGIEGQLRQDRWEQDGRSRSRVEIFVNNLQLLGGRNDGAAPRDDSPAVGRPSQPRAGAPLPAADDFDDDIPF
ncbi:MAG: single-stranded DNA-binding protein [Spirochaetaceae bacterium]|nr:single-stranded DNA-binding protein [Spirochaetaceae bacterium]